MVKRHPYPGTLNMCLYHIREYIVCIVSEGLSWRSKWEMRNTKSIIMVCHRLICCMLVLNITLSLAVDWRDIIPKPSDFKLPDDLSILIYMVCH
jgi:hypothetical protein